MYSRNGKNLAAFSRTGVFETRFHLVFRKITSVYKRYNLSRQQMKALSKFLKSPPLLLWFCIVVPSFPWRALLTCAVVIQLCRWQQQRDFCRISNLVPRVHWLFGQRVVVSRGPRDREQLAAGEKLMPHSHQQNMFN